MSPATSPPGAPPRALAAIAADAALGEAAECDAGAGALLRCLAASRLGGVTVQLGRASVALAAWIIDGMDITSRLLLLVESEALVAPARRHVGNDIRVAVHCQAPVQFLREVSRNRVDLVIIDDARPDTELLDAAVDLLNPGGLICLADVARGGGDLQAAAAHLAARPDCLGSRVEAPVPLLLAARTPADSRPVRRGGRSARQAAGRSPVTNLR